MMYDNDKRRREWFQEYVTRIERGVIKAPHPGVLYVCPCCGYPTLHERGSYEICSLCNWEDDGQDDPYAVEIWGGPNRAYSLTEARENFKKNLVMYGTLDPRIGGADSLLEKKAKESMIDAFEQMRDETGIEALDKLWDQVSESQKVLYQETLRKVREYEELHKK
jgi:hypothetical protein